MKSIEEKNNEKLKYYTLTDSELKILSLYLGGSGRPPMSIEEIAAMYFQNDFEAAKNIAAAVLEGKKTGFKCDYPYDNLPDDLATSDDAEYGIAVSESSVHSPYSTTLYLPPKNIVVGIGCKKGTPADIISEAVKKVFSENGISLRRICEAASIDLKADEAGLLEFCHCKGVSFVTYSAEELMKVSGDFTASEFVRSITGVDNICERSAVLCSGGKLVIRKTALNGVTVAVAEKPVRIDFSKKVI